MARRLTINGLVPPTEFPAGRYEQIHEIVLKRLSGDALYEHYTGAWNAISYRFRACADAGQLLTASFKEYGPSPSPEERYQQEHHLFDFFSNGFSVFESYFYALFVVGAFVQPAGFPLQTAKDQQRISPNSTREALKKAFSQDPFLSALDKLFADPAFLEWREIRNILTHRTAPGRRMYVGIGLDDAPPPEWKLNNIRLDETLAASRLNALSMILDDVLAATQSFVAKHIR